MTIKPAIKLVRLWQIVATRQDSSHAVGENGAENGSIYFGSSEQKIAEKFAELCIWQDLPVAGDSPLPVR